MFKKCAVMGIYSVTPVHAGSGNELSYIDLPIQRERHTRYPVIWGQSLKGVLRDAYDKSRKDDMIKTEVILGPEKGSREYMGCISVGDAKILLFPVRSAKGLFVYITSPLVLKRFKEDLTYIGEKISDSVTIPSFTSDDIAYTQSKSEFVGNIDGKAILEDMVFKVEENKDWVEILNKVLEISPVEIDENRVALLSDDMFGYFVKNTTEVLARVAIDESGTVKTGALWWEEYLPTDTLMYAVIMSKDYKAKAEKSGNEEFITKHTADEMISSIIKFAKENQYVQVGGNATVGKGICKIKIWGENHGKS